MARITASVYTSHVPAIGAALATSVNRLREQPGKSKIVVLLTDGQNNAGKVAPLTAAEAAQALGVERAFWLFLRLAIDRGGPGEGEKGDHADVRRRGRAVDRSPEQLPLVAEDRVHGLR